MRVLIEFYIDKTMAEVAIEYLLLHKKRVSKSAIINFCRHHLQSSGQRFEIEPSTALYDSLEEEDRIDEQIIDETYKKYWK